MNVNGDAARSRDVMDGEPVKRRLLPRRLLGLLAALCMLASACGGSDELVVQPPVIDSDTSTSAVDDRSTDDSSTSEPDAQESGGSADTSNDSTSSSTSAGPTAQGNAAAAPEGCSDESTPVSRAARVGVPESAGITIVDAVPLVTCARIARVTADDFETVLGSADWARFLNDDKIVFGGLFAPTYTYDLVTGVGQNIGQASDGAAVLADGRLVRLDSIIGDDDKEWVVTDLATGTEKTGVHTITLRPPLPLGDGRFAVLSDDVQVIDPDGDQATITFPSQGVSVAGGLTADDGIVLGYRDDEEFNLSVHTGDAFDDVQLLTGFNGIISAVAGLPDGRVVAGGSNGSVIVWSLDAPDDPEFYDGHSDRVDALGVLPDGRIVSGSDDGSIKLWDPANGDQVTLGWHAGDVGTIDVSDSGLVVSSALNDVVQIWDPSLLGEPESLHTGPVRAIDVLPNGQVLTVASDYDPRLWVVGSTAGASTERLEVHSNWPRDGAALPDGSVVTAAKDGLFLWPEYDLSLGFLLDESDSYYAVEVVSETEVVAVDFNDIVWYAEINIEELYVEDWVEMGQANDFVYDVAVSADGRVALASWDEVLVGQAGEEGFEAIPVDSASSVAFTPDGRLAVGTFRDLIEVIDPDGTRSTVSLDTTGAGRGDISSLAVLSDDLWIAADPLTSVLYVIRNGAVEVPVGIPLYGIDEVVAIDETTFAGSFGYGWFVAEVES